MTDTHCHIHFRAYRDDMEDVIKRNHAKGVRMITIGTQAQTSKKAVEAAERYGLWCTVGLHPSHTHEHTLHEDLDEDIPLNVETFDKEFYRTLIRSSKRVVAVGEVGLDFYRLPDDEPLRASVIDAQTRALETALELAHEENLPVVLHVRDAHEAMQAILKRFTEQGKLVPRGVVHCFTGTLEEARRYHALGFFTSLTGIITFPDRKDFSKMTPIQRMVADLSLEWIMLETDAPYLSPHPYRGQRNEPYRVELVAQKIAELKQIDVKEVERITDKNVKKLFTLSQS